MNRNELIELIQERIEDLAQLKNEMIFLAPKKEISKTLELNRELLKRLWYKKEQGTDLIQ